MHSFVSQILVTIFAFMIYELPVSISETYHQVKGNEISHAPMFTIDPISSSSMKNNNYKINPIAQDFIPLVVIAPTVYEERDIDHYLPLFAQYRTKDYFLLI
jgi:hypothetical protein